MLDQDMQRSRGRRVVPADHGAGDRHPRAGVRQDDCAALRFQFGRSLKDSGDDIILRGHRCSLSVSVFLI